MRYPSTRHSRQRLGSIVAAVVFGLVLVSCGSSGPEGQSSSESAKASNSSSGPTDSANPVSFKLVEPGYLTVATTGDVAPILELPTSNSGELKGTNGMILEGFAKANGLKIRQYKTTFDSAILAVQQGRVDVMPGIYYSEERAKAIYYTLPNTIVSLGVITLDSFDYTGPESLKGEKVGITKGQVWIPKVQDFFGSGMTLYPSNTTAAQALLNGQVSAYLQSLSGTLNAPLNDNASKISFHPVKPGDFGLAKEDIDNLTYMGVSCKNSALASAIDKYYSGIIDSGKWNTMLTAANIDKLFWVANPMKPAELCGS